jgi:peptidyl-tRNA hydrolase
MHGLSFQPVCFCLLMHRRPLNVMTAAPGKMVDHVLGEFSRSEKRVLEEVLYDSCGAVEDWIEEDDTDKVMNRVNAPR